MSMATSLEVRVPMLDHEFVGWVAGLPMEWKLRTGSRKFILKKLAERLGYRLRFSTGASRVSNCRWLIGCGTA